jgi:putative aldouronate transport system permease protein
MKVSIGRRVFEGINFLIMLGLCAVIVLPFVHIIAISLSNAQAITRMEVGLIPKGFYLDAYKKMVVNHVFVRGFINTIFITLIYTSLAIIICIMSAYAFSRKFYGKKALNYFFIITMYFNGGLIPTSLK